MGCYDGNYEGVSIELLRSIDESLKQLVRQSKVAAPKAVSDDRDLDSAYGDEKVRFNPRDWTGDTMKGRRMSECQPEFLDLLAEGYAYFGEKNEKSGAKTDQGKPKAEFDRRSERRARGWAKRLRAGWKPTTIPPLGSFSAPSGFGESHFEEDDSL